MKFDLHTIFLLRQQLGHGAGQLDIMRRVMPTNAAPMHVELDDPIGAVVRSVQEIGPVATESLITCRSDVVMNWIRKGVVTFLAVQIGIGIIGCRVGDGCETAQPENNGQSYFGSRLHGRRRGALRFVVIRA